MKKKTITVFTPSYNRKHTLPRLYASLLRQTYKDFCWLIIDDGSSDGTNVLVNKWMESSKIDISYIYQDNQGMHGAHNTAYDNIETELNVCIDSDDYMPKNAIELILKKWSEISDKKNIAGIVGLDSDEEGKIIGTYIPDYLKLCTLSDLYQKHKVKGDKKLVYRTSIPKKYPPYPIFKNEKLVPLDYKYLLIDQDYLLATLNEILIIVDYQIDGSSNTIVKQYRKYPRGFAFSRISRIKYASTFKEKIKNMIHLISCSIFLKDFSLLLQPKKPFLLLISLPFGLALNIYVRLKTKGHIN